MLVFGNGKRIGFWELRINYLRIINLLSGCGVKNLAILPVALFFLSSVIGGLVFIIGIAHASLARPITDGKKESYNASSLGFELFP